MQRNEKKQRKGSCWMYGISVTTSSSCHLGNVRLCVSLTHISTGSLSSRTCSPRLITQVVLLVKHGSVKVTPFVGFFFYFINLLIEIVNGLMVVCDVIRPTVAHFATAVDDKSDGCYLLPHSHWTITFLTFLLFMYFQI